jgi:hypothetical protein
LATIRNFDDENVGVMLTVKVELMYVVLDTAVCVVVVAETTCMIRNAPRKLLTYAAVRISPATAVAGSVVGVAMIVSFRN